MRTIIFFALCGLITAGLLVGRAAAIDEGGFDINEGIFGFLLGAMPGCGFGLLIGMLVRVILTIKHDTN